MILLIPTVAEAVIISVIFTFHYDSINSHQRAIRMHHYKDLHFTMILLILFSCTIAFPNIRIFTFHYDSINSRSKIIPLSMPQNILILSTSSKFNMSFFSLIIYSRNTSYFRHFRLLSIPYIFCTIIGQQKLLTFQFNFI